MKKASIVTIGDELLIGQVIDTNSAWIAQKLNPLGIEVVERIAVADGFEAISSGLARASELSDLILVTGGLGPTKDDITKKVICEFFNSEMVFDEGTFARISSFFKQIGREFKQAHREQCFMPAIATLLENDLGTAPGMLIQSEGKDYYFSPGVPYETYHIYEKHILPKLSLQANLFKIQHLTIGFAGIGETDIEQNMSDILSKMPSWCKVAYLPSTLSVRVRFTASSDETSTVQAYFEELKESLTQLFGDKIYALKDVDLESAFAQLMVEKGLRFGTAESCTGGNISSKLIQRSGASEYFQLALVTYSNEAKISQLNVNPSTLDANGAVSEPVVKEMLEGLLSKGLIDIGVAVSGIAGPTGGSDEKPVGTICIAVGNKTKIRTISVKFAKDRSRNIEYATMTAINLARKFILDNY